MVLTIIYLTRQPEGECTSPAPVKNNYKIAVYFLRVGRLFFMLVIKTFHKSDDCNNHKYKCKQVVICNVHKHHPFRKTRNRWEHVPGRLGKYIILSI